jgi:DNA polymerase III delta prime subunit
MDLDKEIFEGKKLSDIVKEVYNKHKEQDNIIGQEITRLSELIGSPGDAIIIVPLLKGFFDSSLKNDEVLMKILLLFQKASEKQQNNDSDQSMLSEKDIAQLFSEVNSIIPKEDKKLIN